MDEAEEDMCLQNTDNDCEVNEVQLQINEDEVVPKTKIMNPRTPKRNTARKLTNRSKQNVGTKRRKYARSKKETLDVTTSFIVDSFHQLIPLQNSSETSHLLPILDVLEKYHFKYEVTQESHMQDNFFMRDKYMNAFTEHYPEYLCIDFVCEIPELELNLCIFIGIDANGYCEIISMGLIKSLDKGLLWLCELFKKYNANWCKLRLIICDKKAKNFDIIKMAFPEKMVLISFFHSLKALKKDLASMVHVISQEDVDEIINIFEQMVFATDESTYVELLRQIKLMPSSFVTFFRKVWHQKKGTWSLGQINTKVFLRPLNKYLLGVRKELRPLVNIQSSVVNVIEKLGSYLEMTRKEKFHNFTSAFNTTSVHNKEPLYKRYSMFLTHFATKLVLEQFESSRNIINIRKLSCGKYICESEDIVETNACSCNFFQLFSLPCYHIYAIRKDLSLPLLAEMLGSNRWIAANHLNTFVDLHKTFVSEGDDCEQIHTEKIERFEMWFKACAEMWPLLIDCPDDVSQERVKVLKNLVEAWREGFKINVETTDEDSFPSTSDMLEDNSVDNWKEMYGVTLRDVLDSDNDFSSFSLDTEISSGLIL